MPQTILTLATEIDPDRVEDARDLIDGLRLTIEGPDAGGDQFKPLAASLPGLHFAAIMIFEDERFDPLLTLELNFDGPTRTFLPSLLTSSLAPDLHKVLTYCKAPEEAEALQKYRDAVDAGRLVPYLETLIVKPAIFHQGNRGLDRARILKEAALFDDVQRKLAEPTFGPAIDASKLHLALRASMRDAHPWLDQPAPDRISRLERAQDIGKLILLVALVLAALLAPGLILALASPILGAILGWAALALILFEAARFALRPKTPRPLAPPRSAHLPRSPPIVWDANTVTLVGIGGPTLALLVAFLLWPATRAADAGFVLIVIGILHWLRRLERTDRVHQKPRTDPARLREIMELEDRIKQNHMGSLVHVKPGVLRAILIRLGLHGLGLWLRVTATDGYLTDMATIHFAHWALLDNGSRLVFFSNFDSSWESYLDDFIEKAHWGLTLAWSNGVGFPRTRFLVEDGATDGPLFKAWARHSMARGLFWVSAYPELSVGQIERNCAIATGLRATSLSRAEAEAWAARL